MRPRLLVLVLALCPLFPSTGGGADSLPPILLAGLGRSGGKAVAILDIKGDRRFVRQGDELTLSAGAGIVRLRVVEIAKDHVRIDLDSGQSLVLRMGAQVKADVGAAAPREPAKDLGDARKLEAWIAAQDFVRDRMRSPSTATFGSQDPETRVKSLGGDRYLVQGWVDAQNPLGAMIRTDFTLTLLKKPDSWALTAGPVMVPR